MKSQEERQKRDTSVRRDKLYIENMENESDNIRSTDTNKYRMKDVDTSRCCRKDLL